MKSKISIHKQDILSSILWKWYSNCSLVYNKLKNHKIRSLSSVVYVFQCLKVINCHKLSDYLPFILRITWNVPICEHDMGLFSIKNIKLVIMKCPVSCFMTPTNRLRMRCIFFNKSVNLAYLSPVILVQKLSLGHCFSSTLRLIGVRFT